jgi:isocitrate dehydrogenase
MVSSKGLKIWPGNIMTKIDGDYFSLRFVPANQEKITTHKEITYLLNKISDAGLDFVQTENLYSYDDKLGFSLSQGE